MNERADLIEEVQAVCHAYLRVDLPDGLPVIAAALRSDAALKARLGPLALRFAWLAAQERDMNDAGDLLHCPCPVIDKDPSQ